MAAHKDDMLKFATGAYRNPAKDKIDIEACESPIVLERYAQYLHENSYLPDGSRRPNDNWQKGIPRDSYMKSMVRHFVDVWKIHRGFTAHMTLENALCALMFNVKGYLYEVLRDKESQMRLPL